MKEKKKVPELRFPGFEGEWVKRSGESITHKITKGSSPNWQGFKYVDSGILFITSENVRDGFLDISTPKYVPLKFNEKQKSSILKKGDLLINIVGASIGRSTIYNLNLLANINQAVAVMRIKEKYNLSFVSYTIQLERTQKSFAGIQSESARPNLSLTDLRLLSFYIPSLSEQTKIANFLSDIDSKIEKLTRKKELMEQYKKGMMQTLFSREIRFKDENGKDYPDWEEKRANEIFDNITDKNHNGDLPLLAVTQDQGVVDREAAGIEIKTSQQSIQSYKMIDKGDFVISLRSFQGGIEYSNLKGISSPAYTVLRPKIKISDNFYKAYFKKEEFISKLNNAVIGIRDGKQISYGVFSDMRIPYPSFPEQEKIANFLNIFDKKIDQVEKELSAIKEFKKGLLQKMFV
jgi:type I restriction enzyme S subunit